MDITQTVQFCYLMNFCVNDSYKHLFLTIQDSQNFNVHQLIRWSKLMLMQKAGLSWNIKIHDGYAPSSEHLAGVHVIDAVVPFVTHMCSRYVVILCHVYSLHQLYIVQFVMDTLCTYCCTCCNVYSLCLLQHTPSEYKLMKYIERTDDHW